MEFSDPVYDYIKKSILTDEGDIVVKGSSVPERLGVGSKGNVLTVNDTEDGLEYKSGSDLDFLGKQTKTSQTYITSSWATLFTNDNISVSEGEVYEIFVAGYFRDLGTSWTELQLSSDENNNVAVEVDGEVLTSTFLFIKNIPYFYDNITHVLRSFKVYIKDDGIFDYKISVRCSTSISPEIDANKCHTWYNKLK